ncbi:MAG TPA: hypothetical protein VKC60_17085 [Opitutaceae bacterium]|nr:hypothetical protein [Opitutaceae bacterium]
MIGITIGPRVGFPARKIPGSKSTLITDRKKSRKDAEQGASFSEFLS